MDKPIPEAVELLRAFQSQLGSCRPDDDEDAAETWDRIDAVCQTLTAAQQRDSEDVVLWIAQCELDSLLATPEGESAFGIVWSRPIGQAGVPIYAAPPSAPVGLVEAATNALEWIAAGPEGKQAHSALKRALAQQPTPPSGMEGLLADLETIWHSVSDDKETSAAYQRLKSALATQPEGGA